MVNAMSVLLVLVMDGFLVHQGANFVRLPLSMLWQIVIVFVLQCLAYAAWQVLIYPNFTSPLRHLPGPKNNSLFMGQFYYINKKTLCEPYREWINSIPNQGIIRYKFILNTERLLITSPKALADVLVAKNYDYVKPKQVRQALGPTVGLGVFLQEGEEHKHQRKHLTPAFAYRHVKDLYSVFWQKAIELSDELAVNLDAVEKGTGSKPAIEVNEWCARATLDIIGLAGMGRDFKSIQNPDGELSACYRTMRKVLLSKNFTIFELLLSTIISSSDLGMARNKKSEELNNVGSAVRRIARELVQSKRAKLRTEKDRDIDILSVALESGVFSDEDLVDQVMTFLIAGHETTAASITWAMYALCKYPEIQMRLRQEIKDKLPSLQDRSRRLSDKDIEPLSYLSAFSNEVFRVFPPGPRTVRVAARDTTILDQPVPKGTPVMISPWAVNMSTELWGPEAAKFDPGRWLAPGCANTGGARSNFSFLTFIHGPRSCLGVSFARGEFMCILAAWIDRFQMEFADPEYQLEISAGVTIRPQTGFSVRLTPVNG